MYGSIVIKNLKIPKIYFFMKKRIKGEFNYYHSISIKYL